MLSDLQFCMFCCWTYNVDPNKVSCCRFLKGYPKAGGGEDVDFCLRLPGILVSVPDAVVHHPLWPGLQVTLFLLQTNLAGVCFACVPKQPPPHLCCTCSVRTVNDLLLYCNYAPTCEHASFLQMYPLFGGLALFGSVIGL